MSIEFDWQSHRKYSHVESKSIDLIFRVYRNTYALNTTEHSEFTNTHDDCPINLQFTMMIRIQMTNTNDIYDQLISTLTTYEACADNGLS